MSSYAATVNIRHISTSSRSRDGLSIRAARKAALDNLSYITRASKADDLDVIGWSQGEALVAQDAGDREAMREMTHWAIDARAARHTEANGVRLADKVLVSLPRDATPEHHREMLVGILGDLGRDSDAWLVGAIHRDRAGNPHAHILAIDGLETREAAMERRPDAKRVRRRDQLRMNDGGNRQELRQRIATQINRVSQEHGYRRAEIRSLADQGIEHAAGEHEGPHGSARRTQRERSRAADELFAAPARTTPKDGFDWLADEEPPAPNEAPATPQLATPPQAPPPAPRGPTSPPAAPAKTEPPRPVAGRKTAADYDAMFARLEAEAKRRKRAKEAAKIEARKKRQRDRGQER